MCFSATASFITASVLALGNLIILRKIKNRRQIMLACTPAIFALQQAAEGFLWLAHINPATWHTFHQPAGYLFLGIACIFWPLWVPWAFYALESNSKRQKRLFLPITAGAVFASYCATILALYRAEIGIQNHHIYYAFYVPEVLLPLGALLYLIATVMPSFITSKRKYRIFGIVLMISYAISLYWYYSNMISVWCFFTALLSSLIWFLL